MNASSNAVVGRVPSRGDPAGVACAVHSASDSSRTRTIYRPFFKTIARKMDLIREARSWLRTPFRDHCAMKGVGCDCVGFAHAVFVSVRAVNPIQFPSYALDEGSHSNQSKLERVLIESGLFAEVWHRDGGDELPPLMHGDLLGFHLGRSVHHCGILISPSSGGAPNPVLRSFSGGGFVHALQNYGVIESTLNDYTYRRALASVWRRMEQLDRYNDFARAPAVTRSVASTGAAAIVTPEAHA